MNAPVLSSLTIPQFPLVFYRWMNLTFYRKRSLGASNFPKLMKKPSYRLILTFRQFINYCQNLF